MLENSMKQLCRVFILLALAYGAVCCTNADLKCISGTCKPQTTPPSDDVVKATGEFCTADPNTQVYPYKILFVVDVSESTIMSDPTQGRGRAIQQVLNKYGNDPSIWFALITFTSTATAVVPQFTQSVPVMEAAIPQADLSLIDTNYLDALALATKLIDNDAKSMPASQRAYTRYDVQWLSDGNPEIDALLPDTAAACAQTLQAVRTAEKSLLALQQQDGFYGIKLSTIYLNSPYVSKCAPLTATDPTVYGTAPAYLMQMSTDGGGTYQLANSATLAFNIDFTKIVRPYQKHDFFLVNHSRVVQNDQLLPDSDQDGVPDALELKNNTSPLSPDPNHTGCSDRVNQLLLPNQNLCAASCANPANSNGTMMSDGDQDTLHDCEEAALGTNRTTPDSDGDGLMDEIETRFGTNPLDPKTVTVDTDLDGVTDMQEIFSGTDPLTPQTNTSLAYTYTALTQAPDSTPARTCYNFTVDNVRLAPTLAAPDSTPPSQAGDNNLCLYVVQTTVDDPNSQPTVTRACKTANLTVTNGVTVKTPPDAVVQFKPDDFVAVMCPGGICPATGAAGAAGTAGTAGTTP